VYLCFHISDILLKQDFRLKSYSQVQVLAVIFILACEPKQIKSHFETTRIFLRKIVVIGGGLAGLISSIQLVRAGIPCLLIEKKSYPFHRVCGEYVSNEALPFLKANGLYPKDITLPQINFFEFSACDGRSCKLPLDLGGFGISRYSFDHFLYTIAKKEGVSFELNTEVSSVTFKDETFEIETPVCRHSADLVIGAFGKRSKIDAQQGRGFIKKHSPYVGVKYHVRTEQGPDLISLHNFPGGYCGISNIEDGMTNLCYLVHRDQVRRYGNLHQMEKMVMQTNPLLRNIFEGSRFIFPKPEVINEISFETKAPVENNILMAGDSAGMITPVCGNGMAIAIHSAALLTPLVKHYWDGKMDRRELEQRYRHTWNAHFRSRLLFGRYVQGLFGQERFSQVAVALARSFRPLANAIVRRTHGDPF
jgi:flavin-dependent dehydrogenase